MDVNKFKSVKMSLMELKGDVNEETNKADYLVKGTANFDITKEFYEALEKEETESLTQGLITAIFEELLQKIDDVDTVGLWVDYDGKIHENSIKLSTLKDMKEYSVDDIVPIYEFFKTTIGEN